MVMLAKATKGGVGPVHHLFPTEFDAIWDGAVEVARMEQEEMDRDT